MIRRKKLTIFTDAKESTTVLELKKMIEGKFALRLAMKSIFSIQCRFYPCSGSVKTITWQQAFMFLFDLHQQKILKLALFLFWTIFHLFEGVKVVS